MTDNLKLWNAVSKTDPNKTKGVNDGKRTFTAIDAYSQIMAATEQFGPYGTKWGISEIDHIFIHDCPVVMVKATFQYPDGEFPVTSSIKYIFNNGKYDDDFAKKVETDLITKALSRLGFNADVFMGKFDDQKYVDQVAKEFAQMNPEPVDQRKVNNAAEFFKVKIDMDDLEVNHEIIKTEFKRLSNDEKIAVADKLKTHGKAPDSNKLYTTILKEYLTFHPADNMPDEDA